MDIIVRRTEPDDARAIKDVYACEKTYNGTLQLPHPSLADWENRLANTPDNVYSYVALIDDEIVGNLGLTISPKLRRRHAASLGMGVKDKFAGLGVGSALLDTVIDLADNWLNLQRIELTVFIDNEPAINLYKKFGFEVEGEAKDFAFRNGEYVSAYYMARVRNGN